MSRSPRRFIAPLFAVAVVISGARSCGVEIVGKGVGEPCTRASECQVGLVCTGGACAEPDGGVGEGGVDGGALDGAIVDGGLDGAIMDGGLDAGLADGSPADARGPAD